MFVLAKIAEGLAQPLNLLLLALLAAVALWLGRCGRASRAMVVAATVALALIGILPWSDWLVAPLEHRFPPPSSLPEQIDGIVVLGGAINPVLSAERGQPSVNASAERLFAMVELGRRYPGAKLVYSGGTGSIARPEVKEAPIARDILNQIGFDTARVIFEDQSRNTWENATLSRALAQPRDGETWLLVTSAGHMPRAIGVFRAAGWPMVAYPVDYLTPGRPQGFGGGIAAGLGAIGFALHEWPGLAYYRWRGWCASWFPAP